MVIGRTDDVPDQDFDRIIELFKNVQASRTFGPQRDIVVEGARKAVLVESSRRQGEERIPVRAWNVFVHTPSSVNLNVEFVAPEQIFDDDVLRQILESLVVQPRSGVVS